MAEVRLVNRNTGSVAVVPEDKAANLAVMGYEAEKAPAKKTAAKRSSKSEK